MDVESCRVKPYVAVAPAISAGLTVLWRATRGAWKPGPTPMPRMSWKTTIFHQFTYRSRSSIRAYPSVMRMLPPMMEGRYLPVFLMVNPDTAEVMPRTMV